MAISLAAGVVVLASLPPLVGFEAGVLVRQGFAPFCHQLVDRSPHANGVPFALCHRCYGIVVGLAGGVAIGPLVPGLLARIAPRSPLAVLLFATVPTAIDWTLGMTGAWPNTGASRSVTGSVFGVAAGLLLAVAFCSLREAASASSDSLSSTSTP
jgi:uncharacterized membrane protein